ncbi:MAG: CarboxypepD reg-like domain [Bacteroidetes bacterium]|nr:CarboxypepD reg-like domain [Bacteroidota bacterium]
MRIIKTILPGLLIVVFFVGCDCVIHRNGRVYDSETKLPIKDVRVHIVNADEIDEYTDSLGYFEVRKLSGGFYCNGDMTLSFDKDGYNKSSQFIESNSDSIFFLTPDKNKKKIELKPWNCKKRNGNCKDECNFLSNFIQFGNIKIDTTKLWNFEYNKSFILKSFPREYFDKDNIIFNTSIENIKDYGKCYITEFKFFHHYGADQERVYVMLNPSKDEVYVFYFEKIVIEKNSNIKLYFNTRGKVSQRNIKYSPKDKSFVLDCNSIK